MILLTIFKAALPLCMILVLLGMRSASKQQRTSFFWVGMFTLAAIVTLWFTGCSPVPSDLTATPSPAVSPVPLAQEPKIAPIPSQVIGLSYRCEMKVQFLPSAWFQGELTQLTTQEQDWVPVIQIIFWVEDQRPGLSGLVGWDGNLVYTLEGQEISWDRLSIDESAAYKIPYGISGRYLTIESRQAIPLPVTCP